MTRSGLNTFFATCFHDFQQFLSPIVYNWGVIGFSNSEVFIGCVTSCIYSLPSNLGVITLPLGKISPQACLASTTGLPSPLRNYVFVNNQQGHPTWVPLSLTVKPAVPATILPSSDAPSRLSSRIVTGTDIIPLWKFWGFSALIRENSYKPVSDNRA